MTSIFCEELDGECFESHNCLKCKYKAPDYIPESDSKRIAEDAWLAVDCLEGLIAAAPFIHQNYLKEKLSIIKRCVKFMENFEKEE